MKAPQEQFLVFTGLDGAVIDARPNCLQEILPAIELMRSRNIPLILSTMRTAAEILPLLEALDCKDPFIVESGGAVYVPEDYFNIPFSYQKCINRYRVIEIGSKHEMLLENLEQLRQSQGLKIIGFSELSPQQAASKGNISLEEIQAAQSREYSEPVIFEGEAEALARLREEIEKRHLRLLENNQYFMLTGDHDEGSAVRLLMQLYREEFSGKSLVSIGLGDNRLSAPLLYTVDTPVLIRRPDGTFDDHVGRRGLKFTRDPGPAGWNQAVIALITHDPDA